MQCFRSPEVSHILTGSLYHLINPSSIFPSYSPGYDQWAKEEIKREILKESENK